MKYNYGFEQGCTQIIKAPSVCVSMTYLSTRKILNLHLCFFFQKNFHRVQNTIRFSSKHKDATDSLDEIVLNRGTVTGSLEILLTFEVQRYNIEKREKTASSNFLKVLFIF